MESEFTWTYKLSNARETRKALSVTAATKSQAMTASFHIYSEPFFTAILLFSLRPCITSKLHTVS
jgi:hypothetical protein